MEKEISPYKDLSHFRLNHPNELLKWYDADPVKFRKFDNDVFLLFENLKPGEMIIVTEACKENSYELFVKCACRYIVEEMQRTSLDDPRIEAYDDFCRYRRTRAFVSGKLQAQRARTPCWNKKKE